MSGAKEVGAIFLALKLVIALGAIVVGRIPSLLMQLVALCLLGAAARSKGGARFPHSRHRQQLVIRLSPSGVGVKRSKYGFMFFVAGGAPSGAP